MTLENLLNHYGYAALVVGTFLEGETILVLGGVAAKLGYLKLPWVIASAFAGTLAGDQLYFFLGRRHGRRILAARPRWRTRAEKAQRLLSRFQRPVILGFRFLYGLRTVTPFVIGMSRVRTITFLLYNILGALVWATVIGTLGFFFGQGLELILGDVKRFEIAVLAGIAIAGMIGWAWHFFRSRTEKPGRDQGAPPARKKK